MIDLQAARDAALEIANWPTARPVIREVATALLWLTDPTPLTWDVVCREPGWRRTGTTLRNGELSFCRRRDGGFWLWSWSGGDYNKAFPQPTTLGELRQVMLRAK